ncbi:MAG: peptide ABC transporter substrate-binding protein, partial [Mesorhizobium sp.]
FYVSSDVYNAVILPADYAGDFEKNFNGTGPFKLESFRPKQGASFVRNPDYWGDKALPDRVEIKFFDDEQAQVVALQAGQLDVIPSTTRLELAIEGNPNFKLLSVQASSHDAVHLRTDQAPFTDKRVRRALALTLDREAIVKGLLKGRAIVGNDTPFAPIFPSADSSVPQRKQDIAQAKQLMEAAGLAQGFKMTLTTERYLEIPEYAQLIQNWVKEIGIELELNILDQGAYYGDAVFGKSNWLDSAMGITDYGHRGVPNVYLAAPLKSDGTWNAAHFKNKDYDQMAASYIAALDLEAQKATAGKIQKLLLEETPVVFGYFYDYLTATAKGVTGVQPTAMSQLFLDKASKA